MVTKTAREKTAEKTSEKQSETRARSTRVVVVTSDFTAEGIIRHQSRQSLLDVLNNGISVGSTKGGAGVVPLTDVRVYMPGGKEEKKASARVKKAEVLFVVEASGEHSATAGKSKSSSRNGRNKEAVLTKVATSGHNLVGKMDRAIRQGWPDDADGTGCFVSLTDVQITPKLPNGEWQSRSVAVNRVHVDRVSEPKMTPPNVEMTLVRITRCSEKVEADSSGDLPDMESHAPEAQVQDA